MTANIEANGALPAQIAQLLFSGLGAPTFGVPRTASRSSSRSASVAAASRPHVAAPANAASHRFPQRDASDAIQDLLSATSMPERMPLPPIELPGSPLDPFGLIASGPSFGSSQPFGSFTGGSGGPPTPWNSTPPSSAASPFAYRGAASRANSHGSAVAAASASASVPSSFNPFSGPNFEGMFSSHDDDLFSSPPLPSRSRRTRGSAGSTSRTREYEYNFQSPNPSWRGNVATAGRSRETALEIDDDSDDDVVEVIDLVSPRRNTNLN